MNSANTETLKLYKNRYLYNGSRYKFYHDSRDYETWLKQNSDGEPYSKTVFYKSINEPIDINESIKNCDEYTYGSITNDGKTYFFFVDDISTDAYLRTTIRYTIDWWSTNWYNIHCTKSHISRYKGVKPEYMSQPFDGYCYTFSEVEYLKSGRTSSSQGIRQGMFIFSYIQNGGENAPDMMRFGAFDITPQTIQHVLEGTWQEKCNIPDGDILGIYVVPLLTESMLINWVQSPLALQIPYKYFDITDGSLIPEFFVIFDEPIKSTEQEFQGICDWYGLPIWECPIDVTIYGFLVRAEIGATTCLLRFMPMTNPVMSVSQPDEYYGSEMTGKGFCYNCRQGTLFIDKETEYDWRDKTYDRVMTQIQAERDVTMSYASLLENIGFGTAFGGLKGGVSAGLGGLVEEIATAYSHTEFDPRILDATRRHYSNMQDVMAVVGDAITDLWNGINSADNKAYMIRYKRVMDEPSKNRMNKDIDTNGYYYDEITDNLDSYFGIGKVIVADNTVVEGACNVIGKQQIVSRLQNGVEFK